MDDTKLRRREFLARTAAAAGLAGLSSLPGGHADRRGGARAGHRPAQPAQPAARPRGRGDDGEPLLRPLLRLAGQRRRQPGRDLPRPRDRPAGRTRHASSLEAQWQGCGHPDPGHGWEAGRAQLHGGFVADGSGNDEFALTYYDEGDIEFLHAAAGAYTVYDRFFCSLLGPTWPNRYYKWSAQSGGRKDNTPPLETAGNQWETIFDRAIGRGLSARYYNSDLPFSAVWGARGVTWTRPLAEYYADCALGTLPNITFVDPPFRDGGGGDGISADEHPHGDVRLGQAWMADVVRAFVQSRCYRRGALFVVYDEWGGFFDHVRPPRVRDARASADLDEDFGQMGFRIPAVAISPFARGGNVRHARLGFESIIKLISYRFGLGHLTVRDRYATNIGETFDWAREDFEAPDLPDPEHVASRPCALGGGDVLTQESAAAHVSDLAELEALADRFGFAVGDGRAEDLFSAPDTIRRAVSGGG